MKNFIIILLLYLPAMAFSQGERKYIREGYKDYMHQDYNNAEVNFRKAEEENSNSFIAKYNTSTALYQQNKKKEAGEQFTQLLAETSDPKEQAKLLHNIGNALLENKEYSKSIEAYERSLKLNPGDDQTRYNLAYALEKLKDQQQSKSKQNQKNKNQQQDKNKQKQDQQQQQNQNKQQQQQQQQQDQQQKQDQAQQQKQNDKMQQQKQQPVQMSQEEAERLLSAILQKEKEVKNKVDKKKSAAARVKTDKDW